MQNTRKVWTSIKQLGLYKLLFSQKVAFCFVLLFISTVIVVFSSWAVYKHIIDSATFGTVIVTFGGITATLAGVYNIVHGMNDRTAMQIQNTVVASSPPQITIPINSNLPPNGTL